MLRWLGVAAMLCAPGAVAQTWRSLGPSQTTAFGGATGRVSAIVCDPSDPNVYFVTGADGGVWKSTDSGATWTPLTDQLETTASGALEVDPTNPRVIYLGSGEANFANHSRPGEGIYRSDDAGATWTRLGAAEFAGRCISRILVDYVNPDRIYACVTRAGGFPEMSAAKGHPGRNGPRGMWVSNDRGETWTRLASLPDLEVTDAAMHPTNPSILYACVGRIFGAPENGIYRSVDAGATWTRLSGGLPDPSLIGRGGIAISPSNPARLYTFIARAADAFGGGSTTLGGFRSDDGGNTWTSVNIGSVQSTYGWWFTFVTVNPTNPDEVWFGALNAYRSQNAGATFTTMNLPHPDVHAFAWDASGRLVVGDDGGVHRYNGSGWDILNTGLTITQCYAGLSTHPTDPNIMFVGLQDNGTVQRLGDSTIWTSRLGGDGGWTQIDQTNPLRMFGESQGTGSISRSTNGGASWSGIGAGLSGRNCFLPPYLIDPTNPSRMLYATERVFVSTVGGGSWTPLSADLTLGSPWAIRAIAIAPSDPGWVYAATNDGRVLASGDGGATFTLSRSGHPGWVRVTREIFVHPDEPMTVYLAGAGYGSTQVQRTTDAGATWEPLDAGLPDLPVNTVVADVRMDPPRLFAGADGGVFVSDNDGRSWKRMGVGMPRCAVIDLLIEPGRNRVIAATQGRGVWEIAISPCRADVSGSSDPNDAAYGEPDAAVDAADFFYFLDQFTISNLAAADLTGTSDPNDPAYGVPDGVIDAADFFCFLDLFVQGC